jgi:hypothetical protein
MAVLTALFALRVVGQAIQRWTPQPWLPPADAFQGSGLPYWSLLCAQLAILAIMVRICWRSFMGSLGVFAATGRALRILGRIYMAGALLRIAIGLALPSAPAWFSTWIPAAFHVVLAAFVLTTANYHLRFATES